MCSTAQQDGEDRHAFQDQKLMVNAFLCLEPNCGFSVEVRRGMLIRSQEGTEAGKVAAVVTNAGDQHAEGVLLSRLPEVVGYWFISIKDIKAIVGEEVWLCLQTSAIESLPRWHAG